MTKLRDLRASTCVRETRNRGSVGKVGLLKMVATLFVFFGAASISSSATDTFTDLASFIYTNGALPQEMSLVQGTDGNFYGTTQAGGTANAGTVFKISVGGTVTTLYSFCAKTNCTDGATPYAGLIQAKDGNFYGTTVVGGTSGQGTVFKITSAGVLTTLHSFASSDGAVPYAKLVQGTNGILYGTTYAGGAHCNAACGTIFKITTAGALTTLYSFCAKASCTDGYNPFAGLIQATDGNFYGTTQFGGTNGNGTVFKITATGTLTTLYNFCTKTNCTDGTQPVAGLVQASNGNFYGTTLTGDGTSVCGTVFEITSTGTLTTLFSFDCANGVEPFAGLIQASDGNFYGTTYGGGSNVGGTVFEITPTGALTTLYNFCAQAGCTDGANPLSGLLQAGNGNLYGATQFGGAGGLGVVFSLSTGLGAKFGILVNFDGINGADSLAPLAQGTDGNYYGTSNFGGTFGLGNIFKITPGGTLTTLYSFGLGDGANPYAGLTLGTDGNFYGTTYAGGAGANCNNFSGCGTVFKVTPAGILTTLHSFCTQSNCPDGGQPTAGLVQGSDGNFYGTTSGGAVNGCCGTVFKITSGGTLTTLYSFCTQSNCPDGTNPTGGLIQATDGNFYGTTLGGGAGANSRGTVFKITSGGILTTLYSFCAQPNCTDGAGPDAGLIQATDGNLYGTTSGGGNANYAGTVFKITSTGTLTTLYSFCPGGYPCTDGEFPYAGLIQATDGNLYGTTQNGGTFNCGGIYNCGTAFQITTGGVLTTLHNFNGTDGYVLYAPLMQSTAGTLYGTTYYSGSGVCCGTAFSLSLGLGPFVETVPSTGKVGASVIILGTNLKGATSVKFNGTAATFTVVSSSEIKTTVPTGAKTGNVTVVTPGGTLTSNVAFRVHP